MDNFIEQVAAGLRALTAPPDAFLFLDDEAGWTWDAPELLGVPVFHTESVAAIWRDSQTTPSPIVPIWRNEQANALIEVNRFARAFSEYAPHATGETEASEQ